MLYFTVIIIQKKGRDKHMMNEDQFNEIQQKIDKYRYTSLTYTDFEDIENYRIICNNKDLVLLSGYNEKAELTEYCWSANSPECLINAIEEDHCLITFIPKEWTKIFEKAGFYIRNIWHDYFKQSLDDIDENIPEGIVLADTEYSAAVDVTLSCKNTSRGFTGENEEFIRSWLNDEDDDNLNRTIFVEKGISGELTGIVCTSTYAQNSEKGPIAWIREVCVRPEYQNRGIARKLITESLAHGKRHGAKRAFLAADEQNANAIHLYTSLGFAPSQEDGQIDMVK